jgi:chorismate mutase/prephenate dehydrogenase
MSIVQVLTHFSTEVMGRTLARLGVSIDETLAFTSPVYLMELIMTARHFAQSPRLYASIQMNNERSAVVTDAFMRSCAELRDILAAGDRGAFERLYEDVRTFFGAFTGQALAQSSFMIDRLVERG